ncbi:MAG TPA: vWA domain-containing protein [Pedobacter sp.]|nr:vWA domain-containing protein [Pedobacter sp.]
MKTIDIHKNDILSIINRKSICIILICTLLGLTQNSCKKSTCTYDDNTYPPSCTKGMDVVFVIDYTGSMGGAIDNIKNSISNIVSTIVTKSAGDYRLALTIFDEAAKGGAPAYIGQTPYTSLPAANKLVISTGPTTNQYLTTMESFGYANNSTFATQLAKLNGPMSLGNGNGFPEPGDLLLDKIINASFAGAWRPNITKLVIVITDAPASGNDDNNNAADDAFLTTLATNANTAGVQCILISTLATSNYETKLIDNNTGGLKLMSANFANIAPDISNMINNLCENNSQNKIIIK